MKLDLTAKLGSGAFGSVWRAKDELGRDVAVKIISRSAATLSSALSHARALARASHPNVVSVLSLEEVLDPDTNLRSDAVVMELLSGTTLHKRLRGTRLSVDEVRSIGVAIIDGIDHIHKKGMEHGDLHAENVMLSGAAVKVIDILYTDSLAALSSGSRKARLIRDRTNLRLLLQHVIAHSEVDIAEATEFNNLVGGASSVAKIRSAFLEVMNSSKLSDTDRLVGHAYARIVDDGFAEGKDYAVALVEETQVRVTFPLLMTLVERGRYEHKHRHYLAALWTRLTKEERKAFISHLGAALDKEIPQGRWWPHLRILCELRREAWKGLTPRIRLRLERLITKDVLAGYVDIHRSFASGSGGNLGTFARSLWRYFAKPHELASNLISLLQQSWYTQNYVGKFFLSILAELADDTGTTDEMIRALRGAYINDAKLLVNAVEELPTEWVSKIRAA
jgi:hypothetical protein